MNTHFGGNAQNCLNPYTEVSENCNFGLDLGVELLDLSQRQTNNIL